MYETLGRAVREAAARPEVREAVGQVYGDLEREIELRRPVCETSGRCCRFEGFGHRMYVTTLELATFVHELGGVAQLEAALAGWSGRGCPFQAGALCGVHAIRPMGCRVFFCDTVSAAWQSQQYERAHGALKRLHDELGVDYFYVEWREGLRSVG